MARKRGARDWRRCIPLALALIGAWRFLPPSEYIIGGKDPGVYVNEGIQIAQRGAIVVHDPVVAAVPPFARDLFFPRDANREHFVALRFMGFFVLDPDTGAVVGQFPHLFPASIAIGYGLDGLTGARRTFAFWGVLGVARRSISRARGCSAGPPRRRPRSSSRSTSSRSGSRAIRTPTS